MPIQTTQTQAHRFHGLADLDDVTLYIEHHGQSCRFTFVCFANAWTAFFRDLQEHESPIDRLLNIGTGDMVRTLQWGTPEVLSRERAKETIFLRYIVTSIKTELAAFMELQSPAPLLQASK